MLHIWRERWIEDGRFLRLRRMRRGRASASCRCLFLILSNVVGDCGNQLRILLVELIASFFACFMLASIVFVEVVRNWERECCYFGLFNVFFYIVGEKVGICWSHGVTFAAYVPHFYSYPCFVFFGLFCMFSMDFFAS